MRYIKKKGPGLSALILLLLALALPVSTGCDSSGDPAVERVVINQQPLRITIAAVGDLLMHIPIVNGAWDPSRRMYDFMPIFAPVRPYLERADYTLANLETKLAGSARGYSGYPRFNSPVSLAWALKASGVDLLVTANNHSLDMGWSGLETTLKNIETVGLTHTGTARSLQEEATPLLVDIKGIKLAFLNYTESTNGIPLPEGREYAVSMLQTERVLAKAAAARAAGAELVMAVLHFGNEYQRKPSEAQVRTAHRLCEGGVDAVIGSHPHVVQPAEEYVVRDENGRERTAYIIYSLGNFISNQRQPYRDSGLIYNLHIEKAPDAAARITGASWLPVWVQKTSSGGRSRYRVLPVHPEIPVRSDLHLSSADRERIKEVWEETSAHMKRLEQVIPPQP